MDGKARTSRKLRVGPEEAWAAIEAVGRLDVWFPSIATCRVEGAGAGARRRLGLDGGLGDMVDVVRSVDPAARRLTYERVESPFPVASYLGTVEVFESFDGLAVVAWTVDLVGEPDAVEAVVALLEDAIDAGLVGLDADLGGGR
jgi:hypothetical protein